MAQLITLRLIGPSQKIDGFDGFGSVFLQGWNLEFQYPPVIWDPHDSEGIIQGSLLGTSIRWSTYSRTASPFEFSQWDLTFKGPHEKFNGFSPGGFPKGCHDEKITHIGGMKLHGYPSMGGFWGVNLPFKMIFWPLISWYFSWTWADIWNINSDTVDGSEIRRAPVEVGSLSHYLQGFFTSQVVQDFFHQQYVRYVFMVGFLLPSSKPSSNKTSVKWRVRVRSLKGGFCAFSSKPDLHWWGDVVSNMFIPGSSRYVPNFCPNWSSFFVGWISAHMFTHKIRKIQAPHPKALWWEKIPNNHQGWC